MYREQGDRTQMLGVIWLWKPFNQITRFSRRTVGHGFFSPNDVGLVSDVDPVIWAGLSTTLLDFPGSHPPYTKFVGQTRHSWQYLTFRNAFFGHWRHIFLELICYLKHKGDMVTWWHLRRLLAAKRTRTACRFIGWSRSFYDRGW